MGDADSAALGDQLKEVVVNAGWTVDGVSQVVWSPNPTGVILRGAEHHMRVIVPLGEAPIHAGLRTAAAFDENANVITIIVGPDLRGVG